MKCEIGTIVVLSSGKSIYITAYNEKTEKYTGYNVDEQNPRKEITFSESSVIMKI